MTGLNRRDLLRLLGLSAVACGMPRRESAGEIGRAQPSIPLPEEKRMMREIPATGEELPVIGLGTWQTFDVGGGPERVALTEILREFVALGGRVVDSSPMYGRSESVVGELAQQEGLQAKLFLATKVWTSGQRGVAQMENSLEKLRVRKLDLMQVHNLVDVDAHLETLRAWKEEGRVRYIGITHYTSSAYGEIEAVLSRHKVDFLQINYSAREREAERRLLPLAQEKGIAVIANRPFAEGALLRKLASRPVPAFASEIDCTSWAQLLLKFVVSHPAITCAIPATSKVRHLRDNMAAGHGDMPDAELRRRIVEAAA